MVDHRRHVALLGFGLALKVQLQLWVELQLRREVIQIIAFGVLLIVHHHHTGQVHLGRHSWVAGELREIRSIQRFGDFSVEPLLQLRVLGMPAQLIGNQLPLIFIDTPSIKAALILILPSL